MSPLAAELAEALHSGADDLPSIVEARLCGAESERLRCWLLTELAAMRARMRAASSPPSLEQIELATEALLLLGSRAAQGTRR